jgi:hypothetical protein
MVRRKSQYIFGSKVAMTLVCGALAMMGGRMEANEALLEAKVGYEIPTDSIARDLYSNNARYELEGSVQACGPIYGFASVGYFTSTGGTISLRNHLRVQVLPMTLGLKYIVKINQRCDRLYAGIGIAPTYIWVRDTSIFLHHWTHDWAVGGVAKVGGLVRLSKHFFLDLFLDYTFLKGTGRDLDDPLVYGVKTKMSAVTLGAGIGYRF